MLFSVLCFLVRFLIARYSIRHSSLLNLLTYGAWWVSLYVFQLARRGILGWSHSPTCCRRRRTDGGVASASDLHPCTVLSHAPIPPPPFGQCTRGWERPSKCAAGIEGWETLLYRNGVFLLPWNFPAPQPHGKVYKVSSTELAYAEKLTPPLLILFQWDLLI